MSTPPPGAGVTKPRKPPLLESYQFGPWRISTSKSHILTSEESDCISKQFELPHLPDMLFVHNKVEVSHQSGASLQFLPLEALKLVNAHEDLIRVSYSKDWLAARQESPHLNNIVHPFDWTYTSNYKGQYSSCYISQFITKLFILFIFQGQSMKSFGVNPQTLKLIMKS